MAPKYAAQNHPFANELLEDAQALRDERDELLNRTAANRRTLRDLVLQGKVSEAQAKSVEAFYPKVERKAKATAAA